MFPDDGITDCEAMYMDFERLIRVAESTGCNLYDMALYTEEGGIQAYRFQPCANANNSYSVAKAFVVTAIGMLRDENRIQVTDRFADLFADELPEEADPGWQTATVEHAMTHCLGFDEGFLDIDVEDMGEFMDADWLQIVFRHPLKYPPGTHRQYSDAAYYLLSRTFSKAAGENLDTYLMRRLFRPMKFREAAWSCCPKNYPVGATGLYIASADMVKLGALYLNRGLWMGTRLLSEEWVQQCIDSGYEFHPVSPRGELIGKGGMYGQMLAFCPRERFALAWHAHEENAERREALLAEVEKLLG